MLIQFIVLPLEGGRTGGMTGNRHSEAPEEVLEHILMYCKIGANSCKQFTSSLSSEGTVFVVFVANVSVTILCQ